MEHLVPTSLASWSALGVGSLATIWLGVKTASRLELSSAKHRSLAGHSQMSRRLARLVPAVSYDEERFFNCDNAPDDIVARRRAGFDRLARAFRERLPEGRALKARIASHISDVQFTDRYRVPFPFSRYVRERLDVGAFVTATDGQTTTDVDGNQAEDLTGSYGVNVFGYEFYKDCLAQAHADTKSLGPVLGPYHPSIVDNVERLATISGLPEISFHMSGTEAVMQAVRLARYHTGRRRLVRFCGAYHGWNGEVAPGVGNPSHARDTFTLEDMSEATLSVLRHRKDIACVLVNPLQALHPNSSAPSDSMLISSARAVRFDREAYTRWLQRLRQVCTERNIVLIFDEIFVGFRLAKGGAQEYFGVQADMVTYGKTLGGGLPVGVLCGRADLMRRFREDQPTNVCFARGTFNSHPMVMAAMNAFLHRIDNSETDALYASQDDTWNRRAAELNDALLDANVPIRVANLTSIWTVYYTQPSRYAWMFQYYLREQGLAVSWIGSGRLIFSLDCSDTAFANIRDRFVAAATTMQADGFWWHDGMTTNRAIRRGFMRELLERKFKGQPAQDVKLESAGSESSVRQQPARPA
ncbi:MAG: aminotransferase class III-fold pyridoxal phosphate-dependent enzyme [Myxococcales bacterium FL481]|nr:MAG: aminotransferase class III-fold pyridoxal phosphate-dependent enzyme [Myxococcales bacterium FL481]